ncbi:MAG TPA: nucleoside hydrolase, partial [Ilumatobacteraceae bacterium]|nr:nucleoside hydrolase [Ilumatobacteraceae bacterium]
MRTPMLIDTDCGIDDAVALWWAVNSSDIELVGCTTVHGNVGVDIATVNTCRILEASGHGDVPVAIGAADAWGEAPPLTPADFVHGADGVGNLGHPPPVKTAA